MSVFNGLPRSKWVASNELAFAIRDSFPVSQGHSLVISRRVVPTWFDATANEQRAILELINHVKRDLDECFQPDGYNVGFNAGSAAGQTVPHLHVHVIPRYGGDVTDPRGGVRNVIPHLGNYLAPGGSDLVTPDRGRMRDELASRLVDPSYPRVDLLVAFVMRSGVEVLREHIEAALERGAHIRLLTTDYLAVTDVGALGYFYDRIGEQPSGGRLDVRVFEAGSRSFHPKAYLFLHASGEDGVGFVGSSNLSRSALQVGIEWNLVTRNIRDLAEEFEELWCNPRSVDLTVDWLAAYEARRAALAGARVEHHGELVGDEEPEGEIRPWSVQVEALDALAATRLDGHRAGLVVMATGLGKTWLAAFDSTRPGIKRVLFVAHREEILATSRDVFRRVRPSGTFTMFVGGIKDLAGDVVFASVQSLEKNLDQFTGDEFDYIVVDEFHHASAPTYRRVIAHFQPKFMLGLTATPNRTDAADLLSLCGDNLVYECGLIRGLERGLLSPFHYRAIKDVADYEHIPWKAGRFAIDDLTNRLETLQRADQVISEWEMAEGPERRAIAFCCSISHADFMAAQFRERGYTVASVHTGPTSDDRMKSLHDLESGDIQVVFSVDLFNEGVDLPAVDMVLMLRPTESPIVFFQQLGRGLRKTSDKTHLDVIDLVGNHRSFLMKARILASLSGANHVTDREAVAALKEQSSDLPEGCSINVDTEVVDLLETLLGEPTKEDRIAELIAAWIEDHHGQRPTALEMSLLTGKPFSFGKSKGGWFGFLAARGFLTEDELAVVAEAGEVLAGIEHGAYSKSFKLVTLQALAAIGGLRGTSSLKELALSCRWRIMGDPRLLDDLSDAEGSFADVLSPTDSEWLSYWHKNPITALTGSGGWFVQVDGQIVATHVIDDKFGETFDSMVSEIVEYRLHRYLESSASQRPFARLVPLRADGTVVDASFRVETALGEPLSILLESSGGSKKSKGRNLEYVAGMDLVLERLALLGASLDDAYVDSTKTRDLPIEERRVAGAGTQMPVDLSQCDRVALRRALLRAMKLVGRSPDAKGGGNSRKALRLVTGGLTHLPSKSVSDFLVNGHGLVEGAASESST